MIFTASKSIVLTTRLNNCTKTMG